MFRRAKEAFAGLANRFRDTTFSKTKLSVLLVIGIALWQLSFLKFRDNLVTQYQMKASVGHLDGEMRRYFYFFYHLGIFPLASTEKNLPPTTEGAKEFVKSHPETLTMDLGEKGASRLGDYGSLFLYYPRALIAGADPRHVSVQAATVLYFLLALSLFTVVGVRYLGWPLTSLIVLLIGSNPFQLYETYGRPGIFSIAISTTLFLLALQLPVIFKSLRGGWRPIALAVGTGVFLGMVRHVRSEPVLLIFSVAACYLTATQFQLRKRLLLVALAVLSLQGADLGLQKYFAYQFREARSFLKSTGGTPYTGTLVHHHSVWHPIFCGLGDFGGRPEYQWLDSSAFRYAIGPLQKIRPDLTYQDGDPNFGTSRDTGGYSIRPEEMSEYNGVLRDKILSDIRQDPAWYAGVLLRRVGAILGDTVPLRIAIFTWHLTIPFSGWIFPLLVAFAFYRRNWVALKIMSFGLPLSLVPLLIYSQKGTTFYSTFTVFAFAFLMQWIWQSLSLQLRSKQEVAVSITSEPAKAVLRRKS